MISYQFPLIASLISKAKVKQLLHPDTFPFIRLYVAGNDKFLIVFTGLDYQTFNNGKNNSYAILLVVSKYY